MTKRVLVALCVLAGVGLAGGAGALWVARAGSKTAASPPPVAGEASPAANGPESAVRVATVPVTREDLKRVSDATPAVILHFETTDLYAKVSGFLSELRVDIGDRVKKGDVLATLGVPELEKEYEHKKALAARAEADLGLARQAVRAAEAEYKRGKSQYERLARVGRTGTISQEDVEEAQYGFEAAQAKWDMAKADVGVKDANLQVARADRDQVAALLQYTTVAAPYDGVVTRRNLHTGAFIPANTGEHTPIFTLVRTDLLRVTVDVPEKDARYLDVRHPEKHAVHVRLDALPGQPFVWKLKRFAPALGSGQKVRAEMEVRNPEGKLYPGMYGYAAVVLEDRPGALTLPAGCLSNDAKGAFVWVVAEGKARQQQVTIGLNDGKKAEITSGLSGTEEIVSSGKEGLRDGQPVLAQRAPDAAKK